jgi:hypothetical protein
VSEETLRYWSAVLRVHVTTNDAAYKALVQKIEGRISPSTILDKDDASAKPADDDEAALAQKVADNDEFIDKALARASDAKRANADKDREANMRKMKDMATRMSENIRYIRSVMDHGV